VLGAHGGTRVNVSHIGEGIAVQVSALGLREHLVLLVACSWMLVACAHTRLVVFFELVHMRYPETHLEVGDFLGVHLA
jgi:hypothetical protein